jgi:dTDP-4-dehydrorhamnose 3,5-epimerase
MEIVELELPGLILIKPSVFSDDRGFFCQSYHQQQYIEAGVESIFVQDNRSRSAYGVIRGMHYQLSHGQDKLVSVTCGKILDVVVDIRRGSPTFGGWATAILSDENHHQLFVPKGFAHGFCVLSESADLFYKCSDFYDPSDEFSILWNDPQVGIEWPEFTSDPVLSGKDLQAPLLSDVPLQNLPVFE